MAESKIELKYYKVIVSKHFYGQLAIILDICGNESIMAREETGYIIRTTKINVDKLKEDTDWVEKIEPYSFQYIKIIDDE